MSVRWEAEILESDGRFEGDDCKKQMEPDKRLLRTIGEATQC
jgi:hypothetical protein